jgi:signal transduction histidine kinase
MHNVVFLPLSERAPAADVQAQAGLLAALPLLGRLLDALPSMAMLINPQRQLVLANRRLVDFLGAESAEEMLGLRPGEILECVHALDARCGCGTTEHCTVCGALRAIVDAQLGYGQSQVCLMVRRGVRGNEPLELEVSAAPIEISDQRFTLISLVNAEDRMLRHRLERGILPQAMALATEIGALTRTATDDSSRPEARQQALSLLDAAATRLARLVHSQSELAAAETGRLAVVRGTVSARELLFQAVGDFAAGETPGGPEVRLDSSPEDAAIETDTDFARKALREILLNALQAAPREGGVSAGFKISEAHVDFYVHNPGEMTLPVQLQVFSRAFSTKAPGRGYGAYFAKLVTERYLEGSLSFQSTAGEGTTFTVRLPRARSIQEVAKHD